MTEVQTEQTQQPEKMTAYQAGYDTTEDDREAFYAFESWLEENPDARKMPRLLKSYQEFAKGVEDGQNDQELHRTGYFRTGPMLYNHIRYVKYLI